MIESLACGTPVIARRRGSVPEVLQHGQTGFICETEDEMVAAVYQVATLDRATCRQAFEERFTATCMAQNYLQVYQRLVTRARPAERAEVVPLRQRVPRQARSG
ncbi:MAG TPA: glycosyltransferase, partial [Geobacteraceae bacterium]|nr:glycosyltransferase [Geobacteraceae bacterium]